MIFRQVLDAYEEIKFERGLTPKRPLLKKDGTESEMDGFKSKRPFAGNYSEDFSRDKTKFGDFDSAEASYRMGKEGEYARYGGGCCGSESRIFPRNVRGEQLDLQTCGW